MKFEFYLLEDYLKLSLEERSGITELCFENLSLYHKHKHEAMIKGYSRLGPIGSSKILKKYEHKEIKQLPQDFFTGLDPKILKTLRITACNNLKSLPEEVLNFTNLENFSLGTINLDSFSDDQLREYEYYYFTFDITAAKNLTHLPDNFFRKLQNLRTLDLEGCKSLTQLPEGIENLVNLTHLDLSFCSKLTKLPSGIENLVNLTHLNFLHCSKLTKLPSGIEKFTKLNFLNLHGMENLEKTQDLMEQLRIMLHKKDLQLILPQHIKIGEIDCHFVVSGQIQSEEGVLKTTDVKKPQPSSTDNRGSPSASITNPANISARTGVESFK